MSDPQAPRYEEQAGRQPRHQYRPLSDPQAPRYEEQAGRQPPQYRPLSAPQVRRPAARRTPARQVGAAPASRMGGKVARVYNSMTFDVLCKV